MKQMKIFSNESLGFDQINVTWTVVVLFFFISIASLGTVSLLRGPAAVWDGVIIPRHDPSAILRMEDVEQDAR